MPRSPAEKREHTRASRVRFRVLRMAFLLAIVTYLDRVCISIAAPFIMQDLGLTFVQMSTVFGAFTLAYSLFEVPSGWLGDVIGPRRVLTRIVLWWSAFTMLTGAAQGLRSLVAIRFLFGAGEAGAFPNAVRSFSQWFPARERGMANGVLFFGSRLGGAITAPIALVLIQRWGWRASFVVFGAVGLVWATAWYRSYRDRPAEHPDVDPAELAWIQQDAQLSTSNSQVPTARTPEPTPWRQLLTSPNLYAICAMYFTFGYGLYFYFTWLPTYLVQELGFSLVTGGFFAALPFLLAGAANLAGGWCTDTLARTRGLRVARVTLGFTAFSTCAVLILASILVPTPVAKALLLALALASADFALSACWAVCLDVAPHHAGVVTGFMNTFGNLGGLVGPIVVALMVDRLGSWTLPLYVTAGVYFAGALAWLVIDPKRRIA
jgi:ACS family glucarate transporter-like MFS transporter